MFESEPHKESDARVIPRLEKCPRLFTHEFRRVALVLVLATGIAHASEPAEPDPWAKSGSIAPGNNIESRFASPLRIVTLITDDLGFTRHFLVNGLGLTMTGEIQLNDASRQTFSQAFDLEPLGRWQMFYAHRPTTGDEVAVRVIHAERKTPRHREDMNARTDGILAVGTAIANLDVHEPFMERLGIQSVAGVQELVLPRDGGGSYTVKEIHYAGPESAYFLGIDRPEGLPTVSAIDVAIGIGGPTYSSTMTEDPVAAATFFQELLGYEVRRDVVFESGGKEGGLHLTPGTEIRFIQMFAPGARTGWIIVMNAAADRVPSVVPPRPPQRGLGAWSFFVPDLNEAASRLENMGRPYFGPANVEDPALGPRRMLTTIAPNGQLIEVLEGAADRGVFDTARSPEKCDRPVLMLVEGVNQDRKQFGIYGDTLRDSNLYPKNEGYYLALGDPDYVFEGSWQEEEFRVLARFPCHRKAREFWYSEQYQNIAALRKGAGPVRVVVFPELPREDDPSDGN